jgi:UPF0716 protein FxsA
MFLKLFILFTVVPILELYLLIKLGGKIGAFNTIMIILATATLGAFLAKQQGLQTLRNIKTAVSEARIPGKELLDGLFILLGGFALLTPGFITDLIGISMLLPFTRILYIKLGKSYFDRKIKNKITTFR